MLEPKQQLPATKGWMILTIRTSELQQISGIKGGGGDLPSICVKTPNLQLPSHEMFTLHFFLLTLLLRFLNTKASPPPKKKKKIRWQ